MFGSFFTFLRRWICICVARVNELFSRGDLWQPDEGGPAFSTMLPH